ncbi:bifunctional diguanylate cyclase/phosphodiesterase [Neptuniibacter halophilus]|uniref:bifunctional diguanylate cyclase/phosphodiesterase n=1 Tax=Neptuniibacter halophilus TaxID=651666 RepID=UPI002572E21C|nr:EAL domain-containing protein [Neptuniibacter halophilus]
MFINLLLVLAVVHLLYGYFSYWQMNQRAASDREVAFERDLFSLQGLLESSYNRLQELGEMIPLVVESGSEREPGAENFMRSVRRFFPDLLLSGSVDALYLYDAAGVIYERQGITVSFPEQVVLDVIRDEAPVKYFHCREACLRFVALPVQLDQGQTGVLVVGREMRDVIIDFKRLRGRDIGLALQPSGMGESDRLWKLELKYLTEKQENINLLENLVRQYSIPADGGMYELEANDRIYQVMLKTPTGARPGQAYWILIEDNTDSYLAARNDLIQRFLIAGAGLFLASLFQLAVLRSPLRMLSEISALLPLLAHSAYEEIRERLGIIKRRSYYRDELDLLGDSTQELSYKLEQLETSLMERAQNLSERSVQLEAERDFVTNLLDTAETIILTLDSQGKIMTLNRFGQELLGLTAAEAKALTFLDLNHEPKKRELHRDSLEDLLNHHQQRVQIESGIRSSTGKMLQVSWFHSILNSPDSESRVLSIGLDFTERLQAEKRLVWMANHDPLTALPNRLLFNEKVSQAISRADESSDLIAVLFCDLDSFKDVNDSLGHPVGDELLQQAAERIQHVIRNQGVLARLGGDEFTVLLEGYTQVQEIERIAQQILKIFRQSFIIDGYEIFSTISIGISLFPEHGRDVISLIQCADVAMFDAKENGKSQMRFYHDEQGSQRYERFSLVNDLRKALDKGEFRLFYQPQVDARSGNVMGVEALLRWEHSEAGMISPAKFIPLAEEQGLIVPIGEWVLEEACRNAKSWHDQGMDIRVGVNIAGQQIMHESLLPTVRRVIRDTGIDPGLLDLEVTENFLLRQSEVTIPKLHKFREMGVSLSMDDFGTGFSSLSYLKKLPLNTLKIDQSFVRDIGVDPEGEAIVKAIIVLAKSLGLEALAEGVETSEQLSYLRIHGCHLIQGFYFSRPLPSEELPEFIMSQAVEIS